LLESAWYKKDIDKNNNEKYLEIEENFDKFLDFYTKIAVLNYNEYKKELFPKLRELEIDVLDLQRWEYSMREDVADKVYVDQLEPIWEKGKKWLENLREEWEREWREGKRDYLNNEISRN
jgi:hypothetical protein